MFTIGAFAIIFDEHDRVLLSHRLDLDVWNLPGGRVEAGEMPDEAVVRETLEETGLEVSVHRLTGVYGKAERDDLVFAFECRVVGGALRTTDEADDHRYFSVEDIPRNTLPKQVTRVRDAAANLGHPVIRRQVEPSTRELLAEIEAERDVGQDRT